MHPEGTSRFAIQGLRRHTDWELARNRHYITHTPDCRGSASYCGRFESITLSFSPETLALWVPDISAVIKNKSTPTAVASSSVVMLKPT